MRLYLRALSYFRADWPLALLWLGLIGMGTGLGLLAAWPMAVLIDSVLSSRPSPDRVHRIFLAALPAGRIGKIFGLALIGLLLKLLQDLCGTAQTVVCNQINYAGLMRVRCDLYRKLQSLHLAYHRSQSLGDSIYRLSSDTYGCQTVLNVLVSAVAAAATLIVMTGILSTRSVPLTALAFSVAPLLAVLNVVFGRRLKRRSLECKEVDSRLMSVLQRSMQSIGLVQAFGREEEEFGRFRGTLRETVRAWWRLNREQTLYNLLVGLLFGVGGMAIFGFGGYLASEGRLSIGDLMVFTSYLGMLWGPLCKLTGLAADAQGGVAGAQRVFEVLDREPAIRDAADAVALPCAPRRLELDRVDFTYGNERPVLSNVCARIEPGQMVAFVGSSGVGKSTLLNLLPRFYDPAGGAVRLDGIDARNIKVKDLRRHVALVLQENGILPATIAENIAYGRPDATRSQIERASRLAGADSFIEGLPEGYDTLLAENGSNLSGGQRQRIAIARALLTEAPIIVLDEPTSALDSHHEGVVRAALESVKGERTIILVSHRLSTVAGCEQIFVMDGGRIVERGTHEQLIARRGVYFSMAHEQLGLDDATSYRTAA